jgi:DNA-binding GntR family transcriptional regulator
MMTLSQTLRARLAELAESGETLGTTSELQRRFRCSRTTLRYALEDLEVAGVVKRQWEMTGTGGLVRIVWVAV